MRNLANKKTIISRKHSASKDIYIHFYLQEEGTESFLLVSCAYRCSKSGGRELVSGAQNLDVVDEFTKVLNILL